MKTVAKLVFTDGYRDELIQIKDGTYYRIKRLRKGDFYMLYKNNSKYGEKEYDEKISFNGFTLQEAKDEIKRLEK